MAYTLAMKNMPSAKHKGRLDCKLIVNCFSTWKFVPSAPLTIPPLFTYCKSASQTHSDLPEGFQNTWNTFCQRRRTYSSILSDPFLLQNQVDPHTAPDYPDFVAPKDEMQLNAIASKVAALAYFTTDQFANDIRRIVANSEAYNSPGAGKCGGPGD